MDASNKCAQAKTDKAKHETHFANFPAMRERYEGALVLAEEELRKTQEAWNISSMMVNNYLSSVLRPHSSSRDMEEMAKRVAVEVVYNDIGASSIRKFVDERLSEMVPTGLAELRGEVLKLRENDARREAQVRECKSGLVKLETSYKSVDSKQSFLNSAVEQIRSSLPALKEDVVSAQQLALHASDAMQKLDGLKARVDQVCISNGWLYRQLTHFVSVRDGHQERHVDDYRCKCGTEYAQDEAVGSTARA